MDLRSWKPGDAGKTDPNSLSFGYRRLKVAKLLDHSGDNLFSMNLLANDPKTAVRFPPQDLQPKLRRGNVANAAPSEKKCPWQVVYDFRKVPAGEPKDLIVEYYSPGQYLQRNESATVLPFLVRTPTAELTLWIMLPVGKEYKSWRIVRYPRGNPQDVEGVKVVTEYLADDFTILAFKLLSLKPDYMYEVQWFYRAPAQRNHFWDKWFRTATTVPIPPPVRGTGVRPPPIRALAAHRVARARPDSWRPPARSRYCQRRNPSVQEEPAVGGQLDSPLRPRRNAWSQQHAKGISRSLLPRSACSTCRRA
jgi:hypothetical protein